MIWCDGHKVEILGTVNDGPNVGNPDWVRIRFGDGTTINAHTGFLRADGQWPEIVAAIETANNRPTPPNAGGVTSIAFGPKDVPAGAQDATPVIEESDVKPLE